MLDFNSKLPNDYNEFLRSPEWLAKREEIITRDGGMCQMCKSRKNLRVHHKSYEDLLDNDSLITLCDKCHEQVHEYTKMFNAALHDENSDLRKSFDGVNEAITRLIDKSIYVRCAELNSDGDVHFFTGPIDSRVNINEFISSLITLDPYARPVQLGRPDSWLTNHGIGRATWTRYNDIRLGRKGWDEI